MIVRMIIRLITFTVLTFFYYPLHADVTFGWEQISYTVSEDVGTFQAFYSITIPTFLPGLNPIFMRVSTVIGTAGIYKIYHSSVSIILLC